jgi:hypothetical protein
MAASHFYQSLIVNPTKNRDKIRQAGGSRALVLSAQGVQQLGLLPETRLQPSDQRDFTQQFELDAAMWYGAILKGPNRRVTLRLFHLFYYAGVIYKAGTGADDWEDWEDNSFGNLASLLSHGGRVLVQIPTIPNGGGRLWNWLQQEDAILPRGYATHGIAHCAAFPLIRGHKGYLAEKGGKFVGKWQSIKGHVQGRHFAFNVALGGEGNRNPFSASNDDTKNHYTPIKGDGLNGHVYINYMPPTNGDVGGMLVGCENAEHGKGSNPHTKAGHGLGGAQKVSATGGYKWTKVKIGPQQEYGGFYCDLTDRGNDLSWILDRPLLDPDLLDSKTGTVLPVNLGPPAPGSLAAALADRRRAMGYRR